MPVGDENNIGAEFSMIISDSDSEVSSVGSRDEWFGHGQSDGERFSDEQPNSKQSGNEQSGNEQSGSKEQPGNEQSSGKESSSKEESSDESDN